MLGRQEGKFKPSPTIYSNNTRFDVCHCRNCPGASSDGGAKALRSPRCQCVRRCYKCRQCYLEPTEPNNIVRCDHEETWSIGYDWRWSCQGLLFPYLLLYCTIWIYHFYKKDPSLCEFSVAGAFRRDKGESISIIIVLFLIYIFEQSDGTSRTISRPTDFRSRHGDG